MSAGDGEHEIRECLMEAEFCFQQVGWREWTLQKKASILKRHGEYKDQFTNFSIH